MNPYHTTITISAEDGLVTLTPASWPDAESVVAEQVVPVLGGTLAFRPDAEVGSFPRTLLVEPEAALAWVPAVYGPGAARAVRDAWASASDESDGTVTVTVEAGPEQPSLVEALRLLARAQWYLRWWPSGDPGDDLQPRLDPGVLDLDLGTLAWEGGLALGSVDFAAERLGRSTGVLLRLLSRAREQAGALREHLDARLDQAVDATLDLETGPADALEALAAYRERRELVDEAVRRAMETLPATITGLEPGWALVLGDLTEPMGSQLAFSPPDETVRFSSVDWALVPARSVSGNDLNVALEASEARGGVRLDVRVDAGDQPVGALVAYLHAAPRETLVARIDLPLEGERYAGSAVVPTITLGDVDRITVHVVGTHVRPSPYFPDRPLPWLSPTRRARADADRHFVRQVLRDHLRRAADVATHPLLCEIELE